MSKGFFIDVEISGYQTRMYMDDLQIQRMWEKIHGLEPTQPPENAKGPATEEELLEIQSKLKPLDDPFREKVQQVLRPLEDLLVAKNEAYGNSALDPVNIFSKSTAVEQIKVRIDDKLSRLYHGKEYGDEDTITDLMGYLTLLRIAEREAEENE